MSTNWVQAHPLLTRETGIKTVPSKMVEGGDHEVTQVHEHGRNIVSYDHRRCERNLSNCV